MRVNRFVLDTNILISYFITNNHQRIIDVIDLYEIDIFSCDELISEFSKVLGYEHIKKYRLNVRKAVKLLKEITTDFQLTYPIKNYIPEDVDDNYIIALALQTNSGFVTSGICIYFPERKTLKINSAN
jgi:putative PIN family toxin of toxin-antitoxin system